jgi:(1->4)-alpha-D-glucan 1-alpha-D-glucosylmutase
VAFARDPGLVAVATRLPVGLAARGGWADTVLALPDGADDWIDVVTGESVAGSTPKLADLLAHYPVALLVRPA